MRPWIAAGFELSVLEGLPWTMANLFRPVTQLSDEEADPEAVTSLDTGDCLFAASG